MSGGSVSAGGARMWAWRVGAWASAAAAARLEAARVPALRAPDQLLVRVHATGVSPIDLALMQGYGSRLLGTQRRVERMLRLEGLSEGEAVEAGLPLIPGRELVGEVVAAGAGCALAAGALVWGTVPPHAAGAHAQLACMRSAWAHRAPSKHSLQHGGVLYAALSAVGALRAAGLWGGALGGAARRGSARQKHVLVLGSGGVASALQQLLCYLGAQLTVSCSPEGAESARRHGASVVLDRTASDHEQALRAAGPYSVCIDAAGRGLEESAALCGGCAARVVSLTTPLLRRAQALGTAGGALAAAADLAQLHVRHAPVTLAWGFYSPCAETTRLITELVDQDEWEVTEARVLPWWRGGEGYALAAGAGPGAAGTGAARPGAARPGAAETGAAGTGAPGPGAGVGAGGAMRSACKVLLDFTAPAPRDQPHLHALANPYL